MDQVLAIKKIQKKILDMLSNKDLSDSDENRQFLEEISNDLNVFLDKGIDFKDVVDALDDSIFISDSEGRVLYTNPAHKYNTGITFDELKGRTVQDIVEEGKLFTGGATLDVIKEKKKVFRLSTSLKSDPPQLGYAVGVPIFNDNGDLHQVVVSSRPIFTLSELREDFQKFLDEANAVKSYRNNVTVIDPAVDKDAISARLVGSSNALKNVWELVRQVASTDATVLITGESGTGKEIVADELYRMGLRSNKPFVKVNCASIPANLLESELFGYEKGAFSGASSTGKKGLFEMANGGTLLLDEIGDMPLNLQVKLLRAIQNREITRVGGVNPISLDVRFIASTNSDLLQKVADGSFRQDLYYRLSVIPIHMPALRDRLDDLEMLSEHFLQTFCERHNRKITFTDEAFAVMKAYDWPGNIRELENVVEYLTICNTGTDTVDLVMLRSLLHIAEEKKMTSKDASLSQSVEQHEIDRIKHALHNSKNLREAGAILGVNASTVSRKIKQYNIEYDKRRS